MKRSAPIKRTALKRSTNPIPKKRKTVRRGSFERDIPYENFIRSLPCLICYPHGWEFAINGGMQVAVLSASVLRGRQKSPTEYAHLGKSSSVRGASQKYPPREAGPLCAEHHRIGPDSHHAGTKTFWERHSWLDRDRLVEVLNESFQKSLDSVS